ncbi:MAG: hypothetical protein RIQ53_3022 [Pseudomonadota bacterium]
MSLPVDLSPSDDPEAPERGPQRAVQSVEVGGRLLLALARSPGPMGLKDLASAAALPAARAHPYLVSFGRLGLIEQDSVSGRYALGPAALQLGLAALHQLDPLRSAQPVVEALARETGLAVALSVWGNLGPTVVRLVEASQPLHVAMRVGSVMSVAGTATGQAFAARLPDEPLLEAAGLGLDALGRPGAQAPDAQVLREEWRQVRTLYARHGLARATGRPIPGVNAFAAAVTDHEGAVVLVLTALGHQDDVDADWDGPVARAVRLAAADITRRIGGSERSSDDPA